MKQKPASRLSRLRWFNKERFILAESIGFNWEWRSECNKCRELKRDRDLCVAGFQSDPRTCFRALAVPKRYTVPTVRRWCFIKLEINRIDFTFESDSDRNCRTTKKKEK